MPNDICSTDDIIELVKGKMSIQENMEQQQPIQHDLYQDISDNIPENAIRLDDDIVQKGASH